MARRRHGGTYDESDWIEELGEEEEEEEDYREEEYYRPAPQGVPMTTVLVIVAIGLVLIFAVLVFRKVTGGAARVMEEDVERDIKVALMAIAGSQDIFWRDMRHRHAPSVMSLYHEYKRRTGVPPALLSSKIARANSPDKAYCGYYFVPIECDSEGNKIDLRKGWALAAVPAVSDEYHICTYIVSKEKVIYARDTGGQPPRFWPRKEDINIEGGWIRR